MQHLAPRRCLLGKGRIGGLFVTINDRAARFDL
jgi:hypothetical protein